METQLMLKIDPLKEAKGSLRIAVFNSEESFLDTDQAILLKVIPVSDKEEKEIVIDALPYGDYSIAIYHDTNDSGKLDTNIFGIPKEPYAFSNFEGSRWKKPSFRETCFKLNEPSKTLKLTLEYWKNK
ncbi:MAG: DUF2141 domain-containing protein [Bacteroidota bacterium]